LCFVNIDFGREGGRKEGIYSKKITAENVAVVEPLPSMHKALDSILTTTRKNKARG
jgi:hypothetical protein